MTNTKKLPLIISIIALFGFITPAKAEIKVVTSIKPIHSLVSYIMDGVGSPDVIVDGYSSPHGFQLKPSHAKMLENADIIFWIGEGLENFLEKPLDTISKKAKKIEFFSSKITFLTRNLTFFAQKTVKNGAFQSTTTHKPQSHAMSKSIHSHQHYPHQPFQNQPQKPNKPYSSSAF